MPQRWPSSSWSESNRKSFRLQNGREFFCCFSAKISDAKITGKLDFQDPQIVCEKRQKLFSDIPRRLCKVVKIEKLNRIRPSRADFMPHLC
jgi:hypothetical protein